MAAYQPAFDAQRAALTGEGLPEGQHGLTELQALQEEARAQGLEREASLLKRQERERAAEVVEIDRQAKQWTADIREAIESVPAVDSNKVFHDQSTHEAAATAIAAFMSGFSGNQQPMQIIEKAIDRSVKDQLAAQEAAQRRVWNLKDLAKTDMDQALWKLNEANVGRLTHLTALQRDVQADVASYQSEAMRRQGERAVAELERARVATSQQMYENTLDFFEKQRHQMRMESIQAQELAFRREQLKAQNERAKLEARKANFLHRDTGIRAAGPNAAAGGWVAPNEKVREKAAETFETYNNGWNAAEDIKELLHGNWGAPGSEERKRAGAAVQRAAFDLMSKVPGLGQKEDMAQMKSVFGGDRDGVFNFVSKDTALKVLQDLQDSIGSKANLYAKGLQYDPEDQISWERPERAAQVADSGPSFGDAYAELKAIGTDPEASYESAARSMLAELNAYPGAINDVGARNRMDEMIAFLEQVPPEQRMLKLNPGGEAEALKAAHSGRAGLERPLFGDAEVDPLAILKAYREAPPSAIEEPAPPLDPHVQGWSGMR